MLHTSHGYLGRATVIYAVQVTGCFLHVYCSKVNLTCCTCRLASKLEPLRRLTLRLDLRTCMSEAAKLFSDLTGWRG